MHMLHFVSSDCIVFILLGLFPDVNYRPWRWCYLGLTNRRLYRYIAYVGAQRHKGGGRHMSPHMLRCLTCFLKQGHILNIMVLNRVWFSMASSYCVSDASVSHVFTGKDFRAKVRKGEGKCNALFWDEVIIWIVFFFVRRLQMSGPCPA